MLSSNKFFITLVLSFITITGSADEPDWSAYNLLLNRHVFLVNRLGVSFAGVDYIALKTDPLYSQVLATVQQFDVSKLESKSERLAFYINAYNIFAIKMILDHWPVQSIKDVGGLFESVWKKDIGRIDGKHISLHQIEHEILRKMLEPRIHMAIVCASVSCPDLRNEPYTASNLDRQLDQQTEVFLENSAKGLQVKGNKLAVSKIFDWFEDDFNLYGGALAFVKKYRRDLPKDSIIDSYLPYNWQLNAKN